MFQEALNQIIAKLMKAKSQERLQDFGLIGGLAMAVWGTPRATQDIDFAIALGGAQPFDLAKFLQGTYEAGGQDDPLRGVLRINISVENQQIPVQLIILPSVWSPILFPHIQHLNLEDNLIPVVSWEALLLLKLYAGDPKDLLDAQTLFEHQPSDANEQDRIAKMAKQVGIAEEWKAFLVEVEDRNV